LTSALLDKGKHPLRSLECKAMEVATMKLYNLTRPSMSPSRACTPSALLPVPAAASVVAPAAVWAPTSERAPISVFAAERAPVSRVHQVQVQAELAQTLTLDGINGTTGFKGIDVSTKRYADGGSSGVPPRGRPV
jgi:hypothetical protein